VRLPGGMPEPFAGGTDAKIKVSPRHHVIYARDVM